MIDDGQGRQRRLWWGAGLVVVLLVAAVALVAGPFRGQDTAAAPPSSPPAPASAPVLPAVSRPPAGAPLSVRQDWVAQEVSAALKRQSAALFAGDAAGFVADALPAAWDEAARRFRNLRALRVTRFEQKIEGAPWAPSGRRTDWRVEVDADFCLVEPDCSPEASLIDTLWRETPDGLRLAGYRPSPLGYSCDYCGRVDPRTLVRPWNATELAVRVGPRTLVAVPVAMKGRLADLSRRAEAAAGIADRFTVGEGRVDRYRLFVADPASWKRWYRTEPGDWVAGYAVPTGAQRIEVAVLASELTPDFADELLRHELAHVSTLRSEAFYSREDVWWLVEGMAEYVQLHSGGSLGAERDALRRYLRGDRLRSVMVTPPGRDASAETAGGRYAVGYFALDHLIRTYGKPKALQFFQQAVQQGIGLDAAAQSAFGKSWAAVDRECAAALRRV